MKSLFFLALITVLSAISVASCKEGQKPTPRPSIWAAVDSIQLVSLSSKKVVVPFQRTDNDLIQVQVSLNGVPFNMWWDTGASVTCISALELQKLVKEKKITLDDYQGTLLAQIADGSTAETFVFNIKEIFIQGRDNQYLILHDVEACVSPRDDAPLLIGQNIIQNLPKHIFHEDESIIEFEQQ